MSIWCSWPHIGTDPTVMYEIDDGLYEVDLGGGEQAKGRTPVEQRPERGNVLSYAEGFSNHHPNLDGSHERPAVVALAVIAPWCVPGHNQDGDGYACSGCGIYHDHPQVGPWLRMEVAAPEVLNFWRKDEDGKPTVKSEGATVVLDIAAATALRDDLTAWLRLPKVQPAAPVGAGGGEGDEG